MALNQDAFDQDLLNRYLNENAQATHRALVAEAQVAALEQVVAELQKTVAELKAEAAAPQAGAPREKIVEAPREPVEEAP